MEKIEPYAVSVDWLQTFCLGEQIDCETVHASKNYGYRFLAKLKEGETPLFKKVFEISSLGKKVATILQEPRNSVINAKATCVKLENRTLYHENYIRILYAIQDAYNLIYKGITRLDLCLDCNRLSGGRSVERFIRQYVTKEAGTVGHIVRKGSARFAVYGARKMTSAAKLSSIRWGSPKSAIGAYCYNKTLELIEVKDKPWIREMWERNGLKSYVKPFNFKKQELERKIENDSLNEFVQDSVWRFEISIKAEGADILNMQSGELFKLSPRYLDSQPRIEKLFFTYAEKAFNFCINTGQKNIRYYKRLKMWDYDPEKITSKPIALNKFADTGRSEKVCYNKLNKLSESYSDFAEPIAESMRNVMNFLCMLQGIKSGKTESNKRLEYLNTLKGYKFLKQEEQAYFAALHAESTAREELLNMDAELMFDVFYLGQPVTLSEMEFMKQHLDLTPEEYLY